MVLLAKDRERETCLALHFLIYGPSIQTQQDSGNKKTKNKRRTTKGKRAKTGAKPSFSSPRLFVQTTATTSIKEITERLATRKPERGSGHRSGFVF